MSDQLGTCQSKKYFHSADRPHRENGNCWGWKAQPTYFSADTARCKNCGKVDNMHRPDGSCATSGFVKAETEAQDEGKYWPSPPTFETKARWLLWWRKYCDNDQSEAPTMCTADLAQTFAEWLVKRESPNFMPYPLERQLRNRISELELSRGTPESESK